jgi:hypothetical protein
MTPTQTRRQRNARLIDSIEQAEKASLEAVRRFLDTVDDAFPHLSDDKPRRKVIDSAFEMTERLVATATRFAENVVDITQRAVDESERKPGASTKKAPARTAKAAKSAPTAKKATKASAPAKKVAKKPTR